MPRRQLHAGGGQEVDERVGGGGHGDVHGVQDLFVLLRAGDGQDPGVRAGDVVGFGAEAAGHDHAPVLGQRVADGLQAFGLGTVEEAAGVHDHRIGTGIVGRNRVTLRPEARQDPFAVHQRLGTTETDHADARLAGARVLRQARGGREIGAEVRRVLTHAAQIAPLPRRGKSGR
jgi:hypothetical protein